MTMWDCTRTSCLAIFPSQAKLWHAIQPQMTFQSIVFILLVYTHCSALAQSTYAKSHGGGIRSGYSYGSLEGPITCKCQNWGFVFLCEGLPLSRKQIRNTWQGTPTWLLPSNQPQPRCRLFVHYVINIALNSIFALFFDGCISPISHSMQRLTQGLILLKVKWSKDNSLALCYICTYFIF